MGDSKHGSYHAICCCCFGHRREQDPKCALRFVGGETAALDRLKYYVWGDKQLVASYFDIRNGMLGGDYSTKLAPWLAHGCVSPRTVYHEIKKFESQVGGLRNES